MASICGNLRKALVTSATTDIGAAICRALMREGWTVIGVAPHKDHFAQLVKTLPNGCGEFYPSACDLTKDEKIVGMWNAVEKGHHCVQLLVNNHNMSTGGSLLEAEPEQWRTMLDINLLALVHLSKLGVGHMRKNDLPGHVVNINSLCGHKVIPMTDTYFYTATKYAARALTEGLRQELRELQSPIRVSSISPGMVTGDFFQNMAAPSCKEDLSAAPSLKSEDVANSLLHIINSPSWVEINDMVIRPTDQKE